MFRLQNILPLGALATTLALASVAHAGPGDTSTTKGTIGIDTSFFGFGHWNPDGGPADDGTNFVGFGVGRAVATQNNIIQPAPLVGLRGGAVILGGNAVVGARLTFSVFAAVPENEDAGKTTVFNGELIPFFRYLFMPGNFIRPYVEGHVGLGGGLTKNVVDIPVIGQVVTTGHQISPIVGAGGGAIFFLNEHFSVDVGLGFDYMAPHTRVTDDDPDTEEEGWDKAGDLISLEVLAGISGWF